ncbi:MAG: hypothetical protein PHV59_08810, partial [Victivallales bacterium]|nr:hypothetical protein [Victivallales bacterium]
FEISPEKKPAAALVTQDEMRTKLQNSQKRLADIRRHTGETRGSESASWGLLPDISEPLIKLSSGSRRVYINPADNAAVAGCFIDQYEDILKGASRGILDDARIYNFEGELKYEVSGLEMGKEGPSVTLTASIPAPGNADPNSISPYGLVVVKKVSLENNGKLLRSVYALENPAGNTRKITARVRVRQYPRMGSAWKTNKALSSLLTVSFDTEKGRFNFKGDGVSPNFLFLRKNARTVTQAISRAKKVAANNLTGSSAVLRAENGRQSVSLVFSVLPAQDIVGFYSWWSATGAATLEAISEAKTLSGGEKMLLTSILAFAE